jgi:hypothetical protein
MHTTDGVAVAGDPEGRGPAARPGLGQQLAQQQFHIMELSDARIWSLTWDALTLNSERLYPRQVEGAVSNFPALVGPQAQRKAKGTCS